MDVERPSRFAVNGVIADLGNETVHDAAGQTVPLRAQAFSVLRHLYEHAGELVTKDALMQAVWRDVIVTDDSLVQCIHEIRRVLNDDNHNLLRTVPRRGYKLVLPADAFEEKLLSAPRRRGWRIALALASVAAVVVVAAATWWLIGREPPVADAPPAIAVLPFETLGGDPAQAFVADGLSQDIMTDLSKIPGISVVARNLAWSYRDSTADVRTVARELGVQYLLEGSVQWQGDTVRVNAQLIDAAQGQHLWAERYDGPLEDIFAFNFQDKVIARVVSALALELTEAEESTSPEDSDDPLLYPGDALVIEATIPKSGNWLEFGFDSIWTFVGTKLVRVNPADNSFVEIDIKASGNTRSLVAGEGAVWVPDIGKRAIIKVDPASNRVVGEFPATMLYRQSKLGAGEGSIWVVTATGGDKTLTRYNATTGAIEAEIPLPSIGADVLVAFGSVWVAGIDGNAVYRIDPKANTITQTISVHSRPKLLCSCEGSVWVVNTTDGFVDRIDGRSGQITASINAGMVFPLDGDIACGGGYVWGHVAASHAGNKALPSIPVVQIDPRTNEVIRRYIGGKGFGWDLRYGAGSLWMTGSALFRIEPPA
jgi:TolB-like protein/DNA-binding winged helix-turn-helix (wHTH) protein